MDEMELMAQSMDPDGLAKDLADAQPGSSAGGLGANPFAGGAGGLGSNPFAGGGMPGLGGMGGLGSLPSHGGKKKDRKKKKKR